jgi:hypothetical protein
LATLGYSKKSAGFIRIKRGIFPKRDKKLSCWDWVKIIVVTILMIAAIACLLAVHYNLYEGERAALRSYGDEAAPTTTVATPKLADFTVEQLEAEDGLQQLLNASQLSVRFRRFENVWEIIFFKAEWLSGSPKVVLVGKHGEARPYWMEIRAPLRPTKKIDLIQAGEKYYTIELEFGKRSFNLSRWQAETLIETIQKVCG